VKPPTPYFGSKATIAPWIVSLLPDHEHYVEPYAGSLAVLLAKPYSRMETVNDLDHDLVTWWRVLRDRPAELAAVCALTPHSRAEHTAAHEPAGDDLETARRVWVRLTQGRGGSLRRTGWRHFVDPAGSASSSFPDYLDGYRARLAAAADRITGVSLECLPALDLIGKYGRHRDVLLYVDPPYLGTTRGGSSRYRHEMPDPEDHRALAAALTACSAAVVLSGYHSPLYADLYAGWHRYALATHTCQGGGKDGRTEVVWSNRELAGQTELFAP